MTVFKHTDCISPVVQQAAEEATPENMILEELQKNADDAGCRQKY